MASFKRLKRSDVISVPYVANKNWVFEYCPYPESDQNIVIYKGTKLDGSFSLEADPVTEGQYERLMYSQINHLFYQSFTSSLSTSSLESSLYYDAMTQVRATGSYFDYNEDSLLIKNFPTGSNEGIRVLSINQDVYGQQLLPYHFQLSSSVYYIKDDGHGNLIDYKNSNIHIGNIFYSHGLATITNQDYQLMFPLPPLTSPINLTFRDITLPQTINVLAYVDGRGSQIRTGSIVLDNPSLFTNNGDGTLTFNNSTVGSYITYYTIDSYLTGSNCADSILTSNKSKISVNLANTPLTPPPTPQPTPQPTSQPTTQPTPQPTTQPTSQPTTQPTAQPTTQPTSQPTSQPTAQPTSQPTPNPTATPTAQPVTPSPVVTYYKVDACAPDTGQLYTAIFPPLTNQKYIDSVTFKTYVWDNTTTTSPGTIGGNLQLVSGQSGCATPNPTSPPVTPSPTAAYSYLLNSSAQVSGLAACSQYAAFSRATYYSNQSSITTGTYLYTDSGLTTLVSNGYYSNGTNYWYFSSGNTSDTGTSCSTPNPTPQPTTQPTSNPTPQPTSQPTPNPTATPTASPIPTYYYIIRDVNMSTCALSNPQNYQSTTLYTVDRFVTVNGGGVTKWIETDNASTGGTVINSISPSSCSTPSPVTPSPVTPSPTPPGLSYSGQGPNATYQTANCATVLGGTNLTFYIEHVGFPSPTAGDTMRTSGGALVTDGWYIITDGFSNFRIEITGGSGIIASVTTC